MENEGIEFLDEYLEEIQDENLNFIYEEHSFKTEENMEVCIFRL